jgi:hypothetical protein
VNAEWELALAQYSSQLQELTPRLKGALARFARRESLHDAQVLDIGTNERRVTILVQEEIVPNLLSLTYFLVDAPMINRNVLPDEHRSAHTLWLYDEIDIDPEMVFNPKLRIQEKASAVSVSVVGKEEWKPIFLHSILLSNGWEIRLRFHRLAASRMRSLLRPGVSVQRNEDSLSRSA